MGKKESQSRIMKQKNRVEDSSMVRLRGMVDDV